MGASRSSSGSGTSSYMPQMSQLSGPVQSLAQVATARRPSTPESGSDELRRPSLTSNNFSSQLGGLSQPRTSEAQPEVDTPSTSGSGTVSQIRDSASRMFGERLGLSAPSSSSASSGDDRSQGLSVSRMAGDALSQVAGNREEELPDLSQTNLGVDDLRYGLGGRLSTQAGPYSASL